MPPAATATLATSFHHGVLKDSILGEHGETGQKRGSITDIRETSYPSRSLQFLKKDDITLNDAKVKLNIIIVGAGLGGLATAIALARTGHTVTVLEQAAALAEVCIVECTLRPCQLISLRRWARESRSLRILVLFSLDGACWSISATGQ